MSVHDAAPEDIYTDDHGKLWRVISICHEPTVEVEEVEGTLSDPGGLNRVRIVKIRRSGGTSGLMWSGWKRIWRRGTSS